MLATTDKRKWIVYGVFTLYWLFAFYFFKLFYGSSQTSKNVTLTFSIIFLFISFACVDIHHRFVTKPNLPARRYFRFVIFSLYVFVTAFWLESILTFILHILFWSFDNARIVEESNDIRFQVGGVNMIVFGGVAFRFVVETLNLQRQKEKTDKLAMEAHLKLKEVELELLKSQVNPHFLFNALNCIYGLSLEKSEQTPKVIMQLSEMLDYMLYKSNGEVLLCDEIKQIENYTAIQKVRFGESLHLTFRKEFRQEFSIAPLLLLTLVENAFKHGKPSKEGILKVDIEIKTDAIIDFKLINSCSCDDIEVSTSGGLGLDNLNRRLVLQYGNRADLQTNCSDNFFEARLIIKTIDNEEE
ncbi:sensor histidine kinase [Carboxylicivirga marina]|uniref:sensor histidine kinase n=1 Tax=Carboxylicivirga marina TaxID=2800988 RepID=UPI0025983FFF|nr:sensor histidine kinase [uncultured Carboxylicivirga sp.]